MIARHQEAVPADVTTWTSIEFIVQSVVVVVVIAKVSESIHVSVGLVWVADLRAIVLTVKNSIGVQIGHVHPETEIVVVPMIELVPAEFSIVIADERGDG